MMTLKLDMKHISEGGKVSGRSGYGGGVGRLGCQVEAASSELLCRRDPDVRA